MANDKFASARTSAELPADVQFLGVVWTDDDEEARNRFDTRVPPNRTVVGRVEALNFAVARYLSHDVWLVEIAWEPILPPRGPGQLAITPNDLSRAETDEGIPASVLRAIPMRHARIELARAISQWWLAARLAKWKVDTFDGDADWAKLAMACVVLDEAGVKTLGKTFEQMWGNGSAGVWNSRIHRLRDGERGRGYLTHDTAKRLVLSPEATRLIAQDREGE